MYVTNVPFRAFTKVLSLTSSDYEELYSNKLAVGTRFRPCKCIGHDYIAHSGHGALV